jgi:catechol 2,3-dioxygenase-like lactoylglutathione lyase family enzyme
MIDSNWKFSHAGLIVRDTLKTCDHYRRLGFEVIRGPYETPVKYPDNPMTSVVAWIRRDTITFEVIQPLAGRWVNKEFLETIGEGVNHLCFTVEDIASERKRMEDMGFPVVYDFTVGLGTFAYFDTRKAGNLMIELLQSAPQQP